MHVLRILLVVCLAGPVFAQSRPPETCEADVAERQGDCVPLGADADSRLTIQQPREPTQAMQDGFASDGGLGGTRIQTEERPEGE